MEKTFDELLAQIKTKIKISKEMKKSSKYEAKKIGEDIRDILHG